MYIGHPDIKARWFRRIRNSILQSSRSGEEIMIDITYDSELEYSLKMKLAIKYYSRSILVTLPLFSVGLNPGRRQVKMGKSVVVRRACETSYSIVPSTHWTQIPMPK